MTTSLQFKTRRQFSAIKVFDADGAAVATFDSNAPAAFDAFKHGLARTTGTSLFDEDRGEYLIGTMDQLAEQAAPVAAETKDDVLLTVTASDWRIEDGGDAAESLSALQKLPWTIDVKPAGWGGLFIEAHAPDGTQRVISIEINKGNLQATIGSSSSDTMHAIVQVGLDASGMQPMNREAGHGIAGVHVDAKGMTLNAAEIEEGCTSEAPTP